MSRQLPLLVAVALLAGSAWLSGCGGGGKEQESTTVITPTEKPEAEEPAAAPSQPAASAPDETSEPGAEPAEPEVAAASTPAEPEPQPQAEPKPVEPSPVPAETVAESTPAEEPTEPPATAAEPAATETVSAAYSPASVELGAEPGGTVFKGRVIVKGNAALPKPIKPEKDAFCIALGEIKDDSLIVGENGGLANVIVWLRKVPSGADVPAVPETAAVLDNAKCTFHPHAFVLRVGQKMLVKNADSTAHNTRISPIRNPAFNQTIAPNERNGVEVVYQQPELVPIKTQCDIHPWMGSFHFPVEHPWAAVSDENGAFEITGLPAGELEFRLWHERMGYVEKSVKVKFAEGQTVEQTFEVDAVKLAE